MKESIIIIALFFIYASAFSSGFGLRDSIGVEKINGQSFIIHEVDQKETLFAISRRYKTPVNDIVQSNEELKQGLKIGQRIKVLYIEPSALPTGSKLHNVSPGETLFSIAQRYQISIQDLKDWNELQGNDLSIGQPLVIEGVASAQPDSENAKPQIAEEGKAPVTKSSVEPTAKSAEDKPAPATTTTTVLTSGGWITHKVGQGQTLFSIAQQYDAKVEDLVAWNGLSSNNLSLGQSLKVGKDKNASVPTVISPTKPVVSLSGKENMPTISSSGSSIPSTNTSTSTGTAFKNIKEMGQAEVIPGTGNHKKYLVLHRTAPVGTIMRIRNEENDVTVFARVVGVLPDTGENNKLMIKVSKAAFDQLKAVNSRFPVEVSY